MRLYVDFFIIIGIIYSLHEHLSVIDLGCQNIRVYLTCKIIQSAKNIRIYL